MMVDETVKEVIIKYIFLTHRTGSGRYTRTTVQLWKLLETVASRKINIA